MSSITVWLSVSEFKQYMTGEVAIGWNDRGDEEMIQLIVPISEIVTYLYLDKEGIEIDIKKSV